MTAGAAEQLRRAVDAAVDYVYVGAATAAGVALLVLVFVAPRRFPVIADRPEDEETVRG